MQTTHDVFTTTHDDAVTNDASKAVLAALLAAHPDAVREADGDHRLSWVALL